MRLLVIPNFRQRSDDTMVTAMSPPLDIYPFDKCLHKMENESMVAISPPISIIRVELDTLLAMWLQPLCMLLFLEALFPLTQSYYVGRVSRLLSTMPGCFRCSVIEPNPHSFTAFTASIMSQKAHLGTRDAVEYAALVLVRNHLERDR